MVCGSEEVPKGMQLYRLSTPKLTEIDMYGFFFPPTPKPDPEPPIDAVSIIYCEECACKYTNGCTKHSKPEPMATEKKTE
jgi:hypothetical protein